LGAPAEFVCDLSRDMLNAKTAAGNRSQQLRPKGLQQAGQVVAAVAFEVIAGVFGPGLEWPRRCWLWLTSSVDFLDGLQVDVASSPTT
jgi:hypothetical protein